ncbi:hypothetical protein [Thermoflavimicrobium dichotomicum]|uniref:hypothetical protein n=1 Tax=Thermoflavimicrobium dichotomicum TaxID=46223 RepID=UPI000B8477E1|nr:hypothetical protein [Thermoflavimicrobium dichotomicum]
MMKGKVRNKTPRKHKTPAVQETVATIKNIASINGPIHGYINIIIQIPTNHGNVNVINESDDTSVQNTSA